MRVFVTGASGFVGSAIVNELLNADMEVLGLVRSESSAEKLKETGADILMGDIHDPDIIRKGATSCDAVIHTAFNHDFSKYSDSCEEDRKIIEIFSDALAGTQKPLVITSAVGILRSEKAITEDDKPASSTSVPRAASEEAALAALAKGVNTYIVRLPIVHGKNDHGFIPIVIEMDKEKGQCSYIGEGLNRWPAVHREDAASLYRLIVEKQPEQKVFHPVAEEGIPFKEIAKTISKGISLPLKSLNHDEAEAHFTWFTHFAGMDGYTSSEKTRSILGWKPQQIGMLEDMNKNYF
ncbi:SDR family oxidoreductase [Flavobacterium beibuense]|uniref:NAD-dependent epimerase/dehydratase n=1 Tax=Flavobacterium beibuense TaxID=657326 RepID=A0A444WI19_9FLAO|nr:SDR family oxidoreductase [Flavobacterium beibuense]RYJ45457.1 NAD-dependent epimerase/dehydratase [Flavobacterium beibuense]